MPFIRCQSSVYQFSCFHCVTWKRASPAIPKNHNNNSCFFYRCLHCVPVPECRVTCQPQCHTSYFTQEATAYHPSMFKTHIGGRRCQCPCGTGYVIIHTYCNVQQWLRVALSSCTPVCLQMLLHGWLLQERHMHNLPSAGPRVLEPSLLGPERISIGRRSHVHVRLFLSSYHPVPVIVHVHTPTSSSPDEHRGYIYMHGNVSPFSSQ